MSDINGTRRLDVSLHLDGVDSGGQRDVILFDQRMPLLTVVGSITPAVRLPCRRSVHDELDVPGRDT